MLKCTTQQPGLLIGGGLLLGLLVGAGMVAGTILGMNYAARTSPAPLALHAVATHGSDTMAIATANLDGEIEALITLDYLTGELQVSGMQNRTPKFIMKGKYNVLTDLKVEKGKKANFLLVTGGANFIKGADVLQPGSSVIYVANANNGLVAAYGMRYNRTAFAAGTATPIEILPLDGIAAKSLALQD